MTNTKQLMTLTVNGRTSTVRIFKKVRGSDDLVIVTRIHADGGSDGQVTVNRSQLVAVAS